jgi:hypothetical protein
MAVSKNTRRSKPGTSQVIQDIFRTSQVSEERERAWHEAVRHAGTGTSRLRFPIYEHLYSLNIYAERMVDLLKEISGKFGIRDESSLYHQFLIQQVRSMVSCDVAEYMAGIEHIDAWLFECQKSVEEKQLRDPDDVYLVVRDREKERIKQGLTPRIRFLDDASAHEKRNVKTVKTQ